MISEDIEKGMRSLKYRVEKNSSIIEKITDGLVIKYSSDLDNFIKIMNDSLHAANSLSDDELEAMVLRVPIYMYNIADGIENLGIQGDTARTEKDQAYNEAYAIADGTIGDKKAEAEQSCLTEQLLEIAITRAYKKLKLKLDICEQICNSARKVMQKRISELGIIHKDKTGNKLEEDEVI